MNFWKNFFSAAHDVLVHPAAFFRDLKKVTNIKQAVLYLVMFTLVTEMFVAVYYVTNVFQMPLFKEFFALIGYAPQLTIKTVLIVYAIFTPLVILFSWMRPLVTHIFVKAFGGKNTFVQTYNAMTYSITPAYVATPFFVMTLLLGSYAAIHPFKQSIFAIAVTMVFWIVPGIYTAYLRIIGVSEVQSIAWWQSAVAVYVLGPLLLFLVGLVIEVVLLIIGAMVWWIVV